MKKELMTNGSLVVDILEFKDFDKYKNTTHVYNHFPNTNDQEEAKHIITLIGWGKDSEHEYWIV